MTDEQLNTRMSELVDGELPSGQANELLLGVLDDPADRESLKNLLRLRQATAEWRDHRPDRAVTVVAEHRRRGRGRRSRRWTRPLGALAMAACVGGLLVLGGVWAAGRLLPGPPDRGPDRPGASSPAARVTPDQMRQVAQVFALHESVAGPLAWYAADDQTVQVASAGGAEATRPPIAVVLKLAAPEAGPGRTLVIVCREDEPTVIQLPAEAAGQTPLRVYLTLRSTNGHVKMQYAIAANGDVRRPVVASIAGQRRVGLSETSLGQLALGDRVLNVGAAAWPVRREQN